MGKQGRKGQQQSEGAVESVRGEAGVRGIGEADGTAGLALLLRYLVAYLGNRVDVDDLDVMSFSLHHLFCCVDSLYRVALPALATSLAPASDNGNGSEDGHGEAGNVYRPRTWMQLQALRRVVRRMQPLCQLLGDASERILASLDSPGQTGGTEREMETDEMEQALRDLAAIVVAWQQRYRNMPRLKTLLCELFPTIPLAITPDAPFVQLLDSASILFGDILPAFQAVSMGDDEAVIMLLYDLLQQTDLLALQFETMLELLNTLMAQYTLAVSST